jgi:hypothetical protein
MHRSGTSCLAGSLQQRGLFLGEVYESRPYNRKGNRENQRIMDLNDAVLAASGGAWDRPPARLHWDAGAGADRDAIVASLRADAGDRPWGFKDPRSLLTLPFWRERIQDARLVGTFRHPAQVARSLTARDPSMPVAAALDLWLAYNRRLLDQHAAAPFPLVDFDMPPEAYVTTVDALARELQLPDQGGDGGGEFFEEALRSDALPLPAALPDPHAAVHAALVAAAACWRG